MESVLVVLIVFSSILLLAKMNLDFRRSKLMSGSASGSLRTSEIKELIREAVDDAIQPLMDKLEDREQLLGQSEHRMLEEPEADFAKTKSHD
ncbi:MAG: hypothetical protein BMS9Abin05_0319 [Rhodothermia bacterium]|nr:MAG: hypothetical protein BMS9Abin05_0319 [Rhodothermia bacterium]